jgi:hypothetical protein
VQWLTSLIPTTQEAEIGRTAVQSQPRQKVSRGPISANKVGVVVHVFNPSDMKGISKWLTVQDKL